MQQLLTAKTRFSEFSDDWKIEKLKNVFNFKKGSGLSKGKIVSSGDFDCVLYGELYTIYNEIITTIKSKTNAKEGFSSQYDDILIPASTTTSAIDLAIASVIKKDNVLLGGDINILRNIYNNICGDFFSFFLTQASFLLYGVIPSGENIRYFLLFF
jgi:type I restriction enzyme S subunit